MLICVLFLGDSATYVLAVLLTFRGFLGSPSSRLSDNPVAHADTIVQVHPLSCGCIVYCQRSGGPYSLQLQGRPVVGLLGVTQP